MKSIKPLQHFGWSSSSQAVRWNTRHYDASSCDYAILPDGYAFQYSGPHPNPDIILKCNPLVYVSFRCVMAAIRWPCDMPVLVKYGHVRRKHAPLPYPNGLRACNYSAACHSRRILKYDCRSLSKCS